VRLYQWADLMRRRIAAMRGCFSMYRGQRGSGPRRRSKPTGAEPRWGDPLAIEDTLYDAFGQRQIRRSTCREFFAGILEVIARRKPTHRLQHVLSGHPGQRCRSRVTQGESARHGRCGIAAMMRFTVSHRRGGKRTSFPGCPGQRRAAVTMGGLRRAIDLQDHPPKNSAQVDVRI